VDRDVPLSELARRHGFHVRDVRGIVGGGVQPR
jgi:hypothetical protein